MSIKWGTIIPLIGGMTVGNKKATGNDPSIIVSYPAFSDNDQHCRNYFKETPYVSVDAVTNETESDLKSFGKIDFMSTVCPCAGLSQLNSAKNTSKGRGSDAAQNEWMYKSALFVLEKIRPKVFWGENAPGLYGKTGEGVVNRLRRIGEDNGYAFSMVKTDTYLHGIPQHRHRTFYFFWKGDRAPILSWYRRESPHLIDYLKQIPADAKDMDRYFGMGPVETDPWFKFAASEGFSVRDLMDSPKGYKSVFDFVMDDRIDRALAWAEANEDKKMVNFLNRAKRKLESGGGLWVNAPILFRDSINSLIGRYNAIVHPTEPRGITIREAMWLMGLPHDFELNTDCVNHICQNVPTSTAADWTREVIKFINGEIKDWGGHFVKQNNETQKIDLSERKVRVNSVI